MVKGSNHNSKKLNRLHKKTTHTYSATNKLYRKSIKGVLVLCNQEESWGETGKAVWEGHWQHDFIISQESMSHLRIICVTSKLQSDTHYEKSPYYFLGHLRFLSAFTELLFLLCSVIMFLFEKLKKKTHKN